MTCDLHSMYIFSYNIVITKCQKPFFIKLRHTLLQNLVVIKEASEQILQSRAFAKILELVLAMGNQLNKASDKPTASAFKVTSLNQVKFFSFLTSVMPLTGSQCFYSSPKNGLKLKNFHQTLVFTGNGILFEMINKSGI